MQTFQEGYRGLALVARLNLDIVLYTGTVALALTAAAWAVSLL